MNRVRFYIFLVLLALIAGCRTKGEKPPIAALAPTPKFVSYSESIQPIFNQRCVVCHSCNDAPCQLDQTAFSGVDRGASKDNVYDDRMFSTAPSRLFIDAKTTEEWRQKNFFPVIQHFPAGDQRNLEQSILFQLVNFRQQNPLPKITFDAFRSRQCPNLLARIPKLETEISSLFNVKAYSDLGMPYGLPPLSKKEFETLTDWLHRGAPGPETSPVTVSQDEQTAINEWEGFLNEGSSKQKLVSRYMYEHLLYAHIYFYKPVHTKQPQFFA